MEYLKMQKKVLIPLLMAVFALITACGDDTGSKSSKLSGLDYVVLEGSLKTAANNSVSGTGKLAFLSTLTDDDNKFELKFKLTKDASLTVVANGNDKLENGVRVRFSNKAGLLVAEHLQADGTAKAIAGFEGLRAEGELQATVHNHNSHGHLIVEGFGGRKMELQKVAKGAGKNWGLILDKAEVVSVATDKSAEEHEHGEGDGDHDH